MSTLIALPMSDLIGLWWYAPATLRKEFIATPSVIYNFYHDLSEKSHFPWNKESQNVSALVCMFCYRISYFGLIDIASECR